MSSNNRNTKNSVPSVVQGVVVNDQDYTSNEKPQEATIIPEPILPHEDIGTCRGCGIQFVR